MKTAREKQNVTKRDTQFLFFFFSRVFLDYHKYSNNFSAQHLPFSANQMTVFTGYPKAIYISLNTFFPSATRFHSLILSLLDISRGSSFIPDTHFPIKIRPW